MTPAIKLLDKKSVEYTIHEYPHDSDADSYGLEASEKTSVPEEQIFKTLLIELETKELAVGIVPVGGMLAIKTLVKALGAKKGKMADKQDVLRSTGYVLGGVSPLGQKKRLKTVIDSSAKTFATIAVSGGRRGLEIELAPLELARLCNAVFADIAQP